MSRSPILLPLLISAASSILHAQGDELRRFTSFEPVASINAWDDRTGTGGGYFERDGLSEVKLEAQTVDTLKAHRIPVGYPGPEKPRGLGLAWITITLHNTKQTGDWYIYAVELDIRDPNAGAFPSPSFWHLGPELGTASKSEMAAAVTHKVGVLLGLLAKLYLDAMHRE